MSNVSTILKFRAKLLILTFFEMFFNFCYYYIISYVFANFKGIELWKFFLQQSFCRFLRFLRKVSTQVSCNPFFQRRILVDFRYVNVDWLMIPATSFSSSSKYCQCPHFWPHLRKVSSFPVNQKFCIQNADISNF